MQQGVRGVSGSHLGCARFWNYEEWNGTVSHLVMIPVFGWGKGMKLSSSWERNIPPRCRMVSSGQLGGILGNGSLSIAPFNRKKSLTVLANLAPVLSLSLSLSLPGGQQAKDPMAAANTPARGQASAASKHARPRSGRAPPILPLILAWGRARGVAVGDGGSSPMGWRLGRKDFFSVLILIWTNKSCSAYSVPPCDSKTEQKTKPFRSSILSDSTRRRIHDVSTVNEHILEITWKYGSNNHHQKYAKDFRVGP
jgi:hypothetical protein